MANAIDILTFYEQLEALGINTNGIKPKQDDIPPFIVDFDGDINFSGKNITDKDVDKIKFGKVTGDFECQNNKLTSLDFAPEFVGGCFNCSNNNINDFDNIPIKHVEGNFYAYGADPDKLSNLKSIVKGKIYPSH